MRGGTFVPSFLAGALMLGLMAAGPGCVSRVHRVPPDVDRILEAHNLQVPPPPGWRMTASPLHFLDTVSLTVHSPDGVIVAIEVSPRRADDVAACAEAARKACYERFGGGQFRPARGPVGPWPAEGFDGTVLLSRQGGQRTRLLFRCFNTDDRNVAIQAQGPAAVWTVREKDIQTLLQGIRVGPAPARPGQKPVAP